MYRLIIYAVNIDGTIYRRFTETKKNDKDLINTLNYYKCKNDLSYLNKQGDMNLFLGEYVTPGVKVEIHVIKI